MGNGIFFERNISLFELQHFLAPKAYTKYFSTDRARYFRHPLRRCISKRETSHAGSMMAQDDLCRLTSHTTLFKICQSGLSKQEATGRLHFVRRIFIRLYSISAGFLSYNILVNIQFQFPSPKSRSIFHSESRF